jgi:hypothetical protein
MLHDCFTPIALCFIYTSCQIASSCFCVSKKLHMKYSWNWTKRSPKFLFCCHENRVQRGDREGPGDSHTRWWRGSNPGRATRWCGRLVHPLTLPFRLYILFEAKTLRSPVSVHKKFCSAAAIEDQFRRTEVYVPAPYQDRELPSEPSPSTPLPSPSLLLSPMMRRE